MPEPATPQGTEPKEGEFKYGRDKKGNLLVDGVMVEKARDAYIFPEEDEEEVEEEKKEEVKPPESEKAKEPEPVKETPPEPPQLPEKQKYKLKVQGEEIERELTKDELIARLQMAEDYQRKTMTLAEERRKIEPFMPIIERPEFKQWLSEQVEAGVMEPPKTAPRPSDEDIINYRIREQEPEFREIQQLMAEWAATLPSYEADILASNHKVFNDTYDRFKAKRAEKIKSYSPPPVEPPKPDKETLEKIIQAKEVQKEQAKIEPSQGIVPEVDPKKEWAKVDRILRKAVKEKVSQVKYGDRWVDPETAWAWHRYIRE